MACVTIVITILNTLESQIMVDKDLVLIKIFTLVSLRFQHTTSQHVTMLLESGKWNGTPIPTTVLSSSY